MSDNNLPVGWAETTIEDLFIQLEDGRFLGQGWSPQCEKVPSESDEDWGVLRTTAIQPGQFCSEHNKLLPNHLKPRPLLEVKRGDLLITCAGPRSRCGIACMVRSTRPRLMISGKMYRFRVDERAADPRYVEAFLQTTRAWFDIDRMKTGGSDSGLNLTHDRFRQLQIPVAPIREQAAIVDEIEKQFTRLGAATTALKRVQANLKRYRASVLKAACEGRLVPTEAELARKEGRDYEPADQLLQRILRERRNRWEADTLPKLIASGKPPKDDRWKQRYKEPAGPGINELPDIPEGWCWATLGQLTSLITSGSRGWGDRYSESGPLFIRAQDIKTDSLSLQDVAHVQLPDDTEGTRTRVQKSDLLVTITGANVTKAAVVGLQLDEAYVSQHVGLVRPVLSETADHVYAWVVSPMQGRAELLRLAYGAGKPGLNLDNLRELCVPLAPLAEQRRIQTELSRITSSVTALESSIVAGFRRGLSLRTSVLNSAFAGQLVHQCATDEPASSLLDRIRAERTPKSKPPARPKREELVHA